MATPARRPAGGATETPVPSASQCLEPSSGSAYGTFPGRMPAKWDTTPRTPWSTEWSPDDFPKNGGAAPDPVYVPAIIHLPLFATIIIVVTIVTVQALGASPQHWTGGLPVPYLADAGRDPPNHYLLAIAGTLVAILYFVQHAWLSVAFIRRTRHAALVCGSIDTETPGWYYWWLAASVLTCFSMIHLALYSSLDNGTHGSLTDFAAFAFFTQLAVAMPLFSASLVRIRAAVPAAVSSCTLGIKVGVTTLYWITFIVYFPVGSALICKRSFLTMEKCKSISSLGQAYCSEHELRPSNSRAGFEGQCAKEPCTVLLDYSECFQEHTARAILELVCLLLVFVFQAFFVKENRYALLPAEEGADPEAIRHPTNTPYHPYMQRRHSLTGKADDGHEQPPHDQNVPYQPYRQPTPTGGAPDSVQKQSGDDDHDAAHDREISRALSSGAATATPTFKSPGGGKYAGVD